MKNQKRILSLVMSLMIVIGALLTPTTSEAVNWENKVINSSYQYNAVEVDLKEIGIDGAKVIGLSLLSKGKRINSHLNINKDNKVEVLTELKPGTEYDLRVITEDKNYTLKVKVDGLPKIEIKDESYIIRVPAMPERGFNFPYLLRVPSKASVNKVENKRDKNYLIVETVNDIGVDNYIEILANRVMKDIDRNYGTFYAETLGLPMIMPVIPRTNATYLESYNGDKYWAAVYEQALDRDSIFLEELIKSPETGSFLKEYYKSFNLNPESLYRLDKQVLSMMEHAVDYINKGEIKVESKIIFTGFSASAVFAQQFSSLYPEKVKMLIAGGSIKDTVIPATTYKGEKLIYPIGVAEHEKITGKPFDLKAYNNIAQISYMGDKDVNDNLYGQDAFGEAERQTLIKLFGDKIKNRIELTQKAYKENGGTGIFAYEQGIGHWAGVDISKYIVEFIRDNMDSEIPVYNQPKGNNIDKSKLKIEIYK